ncbi:hypothetical protein KTO58_14285 [Chitinophaga pendula]|uniref:hypothetical protein n=1 Tax=Chitinophaga TaxID=79328 RepID=UPI000BB062FE|nr:MULTISPECIES: hypothetical protein [Chitinophaga]ASZ12092.1 hypothetical protein CK934_14545 [Chitinophaga sp. MD30]UCJ04871.1 hypothetical protein KTO58_14285 [Chitinophaga pendula]
MPQIRTYTVDPAKRRILTIRNMEELGITDELIQDFLDKKIPELKRVKVDEKGKPILDSKNQQIPLWPVGVSINDKKFGNFPDPNAAQRGWMAFFEIGAPLFEERSNIIQPIADIISTRTYENRSAEIRQFSDTIEFTVGNTINWTLSGTGSENFGGKIAGELQGQISKTIETILMESLSNSLAKYDSNTNTQTHHAHNHKDDIGTENVSSVANQSATTQTTSFTFTNSSRLSFTGTGTAIGRGELYAELGLSLTGTISGTVTTSWKSNSNVSGNIPANSRVETLATQRRQVKQFTYEVPITFDGFIALNYDDLVIPIADANGPLPATAPPAKVIPASISFLELVEKNKLYRPKGIAETVSALDVNHTIFDTKPLNRDQNQKFGTERPHNL